MTLPDPSTEEWQIYLRQKLSGYRFLPDALQNRLHDLMRRFLSRISFESPDRMEITDEMRILIAGHACLLLTGGPNEEFTKLENVLIYRRKFSINLSRWSSYFEGSNIHFAWEELQKGAEHNTGWNPALFRFAEALHSETGWRGLDLIFQRWFEKYQETLERGKTEDWQCEDLHNTVHALQQFTQPFFETPDTLKSGDEELYQLLCRYYATNPSKWKIARRRVMASQPVPERWIPWLQKIRHYDALAASEQVSLHSRILVFLDEIEILGDRRLEVTEEMKVTLAGQACFLLLGPHHQTFSTAIFNGVILSSYKSRYIYEWEDNRIKFSSEKVLQNIVNDRSGDNCILQGFCCVLDHPQPGENVPGLKEAFEEYNQRKRSRALNGWEWDRLDSIDSFFRNHLVYFFEQPFDVHRDLPKLYDLFRDYFGLDSLELTRIAAAKKRAPFLSHWREIMRDNIGLYRKLPEPEKLKLEELMPDFIGNVDFVPQGYPEITEKMRICVATEACILILGRSFEDYRHLQTVELWNSNPDGKYDTIGDANRIRVRLNWEETLKTVANPEDNFNIIIHEFAHVIDNADDGDAQSIPLPANSKERKEWEELARREQRAIKRSRWDVDKHLIREYGAENKAEFFTCATEAFFEKSMELQRDHPEIYETLRGFYRLDPAQWHEDK